MSCESAQQQIAFCARSRCKKLPPSESFSFAFQPFDSLRRFPNRSGVRLVGVALTLMTINFVFLSFVCRSLCSFLRLMICFFVVLLPLSRFLTCLTNSFCKWLSRAHLQVSEIISRTSKRRVWKPANNNNKKKMCSSIASNSSVWMSALFAIQWIDKGENLHRKKK